MKASIPVPSFMGWLRETGWLLRVVLGSLVALGAAATAVGAFDKLGLERKFFATRDYVDERIDVNNQPIIGGIAELQMTAASTRLKEVINKIDDLEVAKLKAKDPLDIVKINSQLDNNKVERDELRDRIKALKTKTK